MSDLVSTFISRPWSARPENRRGGTGRGTGPRAGCSPRPMPARFLGAWYRVERASFGRELKSLLAAGLGPRCPGGDLCRPLSISWRQPRITGQPWRERPRDRTGSPISPAATAEVAHATLSLSQPSSATSTTRPSSLRMSTESASCSSAVGFDCAVRVRALKALRVASPATARG
jgi:hypothetical protein